MLSFLKDFYILWKISPRFCLDPPKCFRSFSSLSSQVPKVPQWVVQEWKPPLKRASVSMAVIWRAQDLLVDFSMSSVWSVVEMMINCTIAQTDHYNYRHHSFHRHNNHHNNHNNHYNNHHNNHHNHPHHNPGQFPQRRLHDLWIQIRGLLLCFGVRC